MAHKLFFAFNVIYLLFNWIAIPYIPNPIVFGWMPFQMFAYLASAVVASLVWYPYFNKYL